MLERMNSREFEQLPRADQLARFAAFAEKAKEKSAAGDAATL